MRKCFIALLFSTLLLTMLPVSVNASNVTVTVAEEHAHVKIAANLYQNVTSFPNMDKTIMATENAQYHATMNASFNEAFKAEYSAVTAKNLEASVKSDGHWLNVTVEVDVYGVVEKTDGIRKFHCEWKAFNVTDDIRIGTLAINFIGKLVLSATVEGLVSVPGTTIYANKTVAVDAAKAIALTNQASLLDFKALKKPLGGWNRVYDAVHNVTEWTYDAGATVDLTIQTPETTYCIYMDPSGEVSAPGDVQAEGDTIVYGAAGFPMVYIVAIVVTVVIVIVGIAAYAVRRKKSPQT